MKKLILLILILSAITTSAQKEISLEYFKTESGSGSCRKFEEKLYINSYFNQQTGTQNYIDSLKGCMNESPELYLSLGKYFYNREEYSKATSEFSKIINLPQTDKKQLGETYYYLGLTTYYMHQNDISFNYSAKALELGYEPSWTLNNMGLTFYAKNQLNEANTYYKKALEADPHNNIAANNISCNYSSIHNEREAYKYAALADSIARGKVAVYKSNMIRSLIELQREKEAFAVIKDAYEKFPNDKDIIEDYSKLLFEQEKFSDALALGRKLLRLKPSNAREWLSVAYIYDRAGEIDSAFYFYKVCLKYDSTNSTAHGNMGLIYKELGMFKKAHEQLDIALSIDPNRHYYYEQKQGTYLWEHDFENSYIWALKCMQHFPERKGYEFRVGYSLQQLKRHTEAISFFRKALLFQPGDDRLLNNIGRSFSELKQQDSAIIYFEKAIKKNPENSYIYHNRAALYYDMGKYDLACADLKKAIDKEYNWIIDDKLIEMKKKYCPEVNTNVKVLINEYKGNNKELSRYSFIALKDSLLNESINHLTTETEGLTIQKEETETASSFNSFKIFPNPTKGLFYIENPTKSTEPLTIKIYDIGGNIILTDIMTNTNKKELHLKNVPVGVYVIMIMDSKSVLTAKRLILEN